MKKKKEKVKIKVRKLAKLETTGLLDLITIGDAGGRMAWSSNDYGTSTG